LSDNQVIVFTDWPGRSPQEVEDQVTYPLVTNLQGLPGVVTIKDHGRLQELRLDRQADSQRLLAALMARGKVRHFELSRPSLHDIFVRIAGPEAENNLSHQLES